MWLLCVVPGLKIMQHITLDHAFYKQMLDHLAEAVYFVDCERKLLYWNRAAEQLTGYLAGEVVGSHCDNEILDHRDLQNNPLCGERCPLVDCMGSGESVEQRLFLKRKDGLRLPVDVRIAPIRDVTGEIIGAVEVFHDASAELETEQLNAELRLLVRVDPLTGIPNRLALDEALDRECERFSRYGTPMTLIYFDLDHFKEINDRFGHEQGDKVLTWMSRLLDMSLRRSDILGRYGGEEFLVLLSASRQSEGMRLAEHLRQLLMGHRCPEVDTPVTASFGVAELCAGETFKDLVNKADRAMYRAKQEGRNRVCGAQKDS
ncbi:MAG: sensor domain-containing diguanylate cyclase [Desulfuromonas sp.]|nr:MAG: sensor domain-containing diguanylate cyclase [Desulfuromonas sp.]